MNDSTDPRRSAERFLLPALILLVNLLIAGRLFSVEYSAYLESNEGTFIALARQVATSPFELGWWPQWEGGLPFVNTYLPGLAVVAGWYSRWTGASPGLAFHQVSAVLFSLGPVAFYFLIRSMTGRASLAFFSALAYSVLSPCAWFSTVIRADLAGIWRLRRLQVLAYYGEAPLACSMAMLPLAILFLHLALTRKRFGWWVLAGAAMGMTVLFNAFGAVLLALVGVCWLATVERARLRRAALGLTATAVLAYAWISPFIPPSVIAAIRANSPTVDGDYHFTGRSALGVLALLAAFGLVWWAMRKVESRALRFFALFALLASGIVLLGTEAAVYVVPQPHRYQLAMDLGLCAAIVLGAAELLKNHAFVKKLVALAALLFLVWAARHNVRYGRGLIQSRGMLHSAPFRIAKWAEANLGGQRMMLFGSHIFQFNDFTSTPQLFGGHKPFLVNRFMRTVEYTLQTGQNAGEKDGEISVLWLKALGAGAVAVPGPESAAHYKPAKPGKFEGLLPVAWQESGDTIYRVPSRDSSLAHAVPAASLVGREPIHGLDVDEVRKYVAALDDASVPLARWVWKGSSAATIVGTVLPGQVYSAQVNYDPGWRASAAGRPVTVTHDGLGLMVLKPDCHGACEVELHFDGGSEARMTRWCSGLTLLGVALGLIGKAAKVSSAARAGAA